MFFPGNVPFQQPMQPPHGPYGMPPLPHHEMMHHPHAPPPHSQMPQQRVNISSTKPTSLVIFLFVNEPKNSFFVILFSEVSYRLKGQSFTVFDYYRPVQVIGSGAYAVVIEGNLVFCFFFGSEPQTFF